MSTTPTPTAINDQPITGPYDPIQVITASTTTTTTSIRPDPFLIHTMKYNKTTQLTDDLIVSLGIDSLGIAPYDRGFETLVLTCIREDEPAVQIQVSGQTLTTLRAFLAVS